MKDIIRKLITVFILIMMLFGCGQKENMPEDSTPAETVPQEEKIEARTAIVFRHIDNRTATVKRDGENLETYEGMRLAAGDTITTDAETSVYLRVDDDKNILLDKDTIVKVNELSNGKLVMYLEYGAFFFDLENKLQDGEEVSFDLGGTTMSIRGTSGQGIRREKKQSFAIFTGLGQVSDGNGVEASLPANTKIEFITDGSNNVSCSFNTVKTDDVLEVAKAYVKENGDYQKKVEDSRWAQEVTGNVKDGSTDGSDKLNSMPGRYGWIQQKDGSWIFSKEAYEKKSESAYYVKPGVSPAAPAKPKTDPVPVPAPEPSPSPSPAICGHCHKEIKSGEEGLHTLMDSTEAHAYLLKNYGEEMAAIQLCGAHYLCSLTQIDSTTLSAHSKHKDGSGSIVEPEHFICEDNHLICDQCGRCNRMTVSGVPLNVEYYSVVNANLCDDCAGSVSICTHCGQYYLSVDSYKHNPLDSSEVKSYLETTYGSGSDMASMTLCHDHYFCELQYSTDDELYSALVQHSIIGEQRGKSYLKNNYQTQFEAKGINLDTVDLCQAHFICSLDTNNIVDSVMAHEKCPNVVEGTTHYKCLQDHLTCDNCHHCNSMIVGGLPLVIKNYGSLGNLCDDCYGTIVNP